MVHYLLHATLNGEPPIFPWDLDLTGRNIVLIHASRVEDAIHYLNNSPMILTLLEVAGVEEATLDSVRRIISASRNGSSPPILALGAKPLTNTERRRLAQAGVHQCACRTDPPDFLGSYLHLLTQLWELRKFEQARMNVGALAERTRVHLHDLSQPLAALQGRLQLLAAKCDEGDPNSTHYQELVQLTFQVSEQIMEIHELHRQYS